MDAHLHELEKGIAELRELIISTSLLAEDFSKAAKILLETVERGNTVFFCGNGGSAAESSHLATELIGRFKSNRRPLPAISLNADSVALTCIANDFGYDFVFSRQFEALHKKGDLLFVLSTSGNSQNIIEVLKVAKDLGAKTIALTGKGGKAAEIASISIQVQSSVTARIQEMHLFLGHTLCQLVEDKINANS